MNLSVRKARMGDIRAIHALLMTSSADGLLLPRSLTDLYGHLRELFTAAAAIIEPAGIPVTARIPDGVLPVACDTEKLGLIIGRERRTGR